MPTSAANSSRRVVLIEGSARARVELPSCVTCTSVTSLPAAFKNSSWCEATMTVNPLSTMRWHQRTTLAAADG
jgi:hypothetical protein